MSQIRYFVVEIVAERKITRYFQFFINRFSSILSAVDNKSFDDFACSRDECEFWNAFRRMYIYRLKATSLKVEWNRSLEQFSILYVYMYICSNRIYLIDIFNVGNYILRFFSSFYRVDKVERVSKRHFLIYSWEIYSRNACFEIPFALQASNYLFHSHNSYRGMIVPVNHPKIIVLRKFLFFFFSSFLLQWIFHYTALQYYYY